MSRYPMIDETPFEIELQNLATHDCGFSRGYWAGYAQAKLEDGVGFDVSVPRKRADELADLVKQREDAAVAIEDMGKNRYRIPFVRMTVVIDEV